VRNFGWVRLNIDIHHRNIEHQVQIKAKSTIQFDNHHEFRIENGFRLMPTWISIFRYLSAPFLAARYSPHFQTWSVMCVSLQMTAVISSLQITD